MVHDLEPPKAGDVSQNCVWRKWPEGSLIQHPSRLGTFRIVQDTAGRHIGAPNAFCVARATIAEPAAGPMLYKADGDCLKCPSMRGESVHDTIRDRSRVAAWGWTPSHVLTGN